MVSVITLGLSPGDVFLDKTLNSYSASLYPGVKNGNRDFSRQLDGLKKNVRVADCYGALWTNIPLIKGTNTSSLVATETI